MLKHFALYFFAVVLFSVPSFGQNNARFSEIRRGMRDRSLEWQAIRLANQRSVDTRCPDEYTKAIILSDDWTTTYDSYGDHITGRTIHIQLYCLRLDDRCGMTDFTFKQKYEGKGDYTEKLFLVRQGNTYNVDCE